MGGGTLSNRDRGLLRTAMLLKLAFDRSEPKKDPPKPRWLQILESAAVASLITVVLGGFVGNILVLKFQEREKRRAITTAEIKERSDKRSSIVQNAYALLADGRHYANALVTLTHPGFRPENVDKNDRERLQKQREEVIEADNAFDRRWLKEKYTTGILLSYYHDDEPTVRDAWARCVRALDSLRSAAKSLHQKLLLDPSATQDRNRLEESEFNSALRNLADQLEAARQREIQTRDADP